MSSFLAFAKAVSVQKHLPSSANLVVVQFAPLPQTSHDIGVVTSAVPEGTSDHFPAYPAVPAGLLSCAPGGAGAPGSPAIPISIGQDPSLDTSHPTPGSAPQPSPPAHRGIPNGRPRCAPRPASEARFR